MSDLAYDSYREQQRDKCLDEIYEKISEHYDGDTLDSIIDNVYNKVVSPFENYSKFVTRDDIKELVTEYSNSLR
jgi:C-terminal processing protease CtpA/Prc